MLPKDTITPNPGISISNKDCFEQPLRSFGILILVEPDPETWTPDVNKTDFTDAPWIIQSKLMEDDYTGEFANSSGDPIYIDSELMLPAEPLTVWFGRADASKYYKNVVTTFCDIEFKYQDYSDIPEFFTMFFKALKAQKSINKVAVFGAIFEDEVVRVANAMQEMGYDTTILTRYCLSQGGFTNLEDFFSGVNKTLNDDLLE